MSEIARLEREKRRALNKDNLREVANISNLLGQELQEAGDYEGALAQHKEEGALCEALGDTIGRAISHRRRGEVYCDMGEWDKALHHQHQHLLLAKEAESLVEEQRAYATIGRTHLQRADDCGSNGHEEEKAKALTEAEKAFLRSLTTCERLKGAVDTVEHCQMRCRLYLNLGLVLDQRGNSDKACNFISQALELCGAHSLHEDSQRCHSALATILLKRNLNTQALQEGQKALSLAAKLHNKALQCEGYSFLAQVHLNNSDFEAAKKCYYKAYKLKHPFSEDQERIKNSLKFTVSLCQAENALILLGESETEEKIKYNEKFGDGLANLGLYSQALVYYERMLELSVKFGKEPSFLAPVYLSLGRTYSDNKQYEEAKKYYLKEYDIKIKEDYGEACKTLLNIGDMEANLEGSYASVNHTYQQARELAVKANKPKLEAYVLNQHMSLKGIPESEKEKLQETFQNIIKENDLDSDIELSEEEEDNNDDDDNVDLDLEYFSDSSNEAENLDKPRQSRQRKSFVVKRNEKGETPLHKACIAGNLTMVKKLLMQNHPVNLRDNCGWLPIHEAANHGYYEIVQVLAEAGAWISDRGGQQCDGITPIHDAAACGNLDIVRLLMELGASITAKTNEGDTPLESLVNYRLRTQMSERDREDCLALEQQLKEKLKQAGHKIPKTPHVNPAKNTATPNTSKQHTDRSSPPDREKSQNKTSLSSKKTSKFSRSASYTGRDAGGESSWHSSAAPSIEPSSPAQEDNDDNSDDFYNPLLEDLQDTTSATGTYLSAIGCVGSAARRAGMQSASSGPSVKKDKKTALLSQDDDVGDDWLDDDMNVFTKKRKRVEKFAFEYKEPRKERKISSERSSPAPVPAVPKRARQAKLTTMLPTKQPSRRDTIPVENVEVIEDESHNINGDNLARAERCRRPSDGGASDSRSGVESSTTLSAPLRLKVRVQDRLLLVPVAGGGSNRTVAWLAEEVTRRYYQLSGLRPHLVLTTQDGAALDPSDPITLVLPSDQAELEGQVKGWDLPPLPDRYTAACQALTTPVMPALRAALHQTEVSTTLDLSSVGWLATTHLQPVLRAIQYQHGLRCLRLVNCRLCDDGFSSLLEALSSLPSLEMLDLRSSSITSSSLFELTQAITSEKVKFGTLCSIDLSYNVLSEAKLINIHTLLSLPGLLNLSLKHCGISLIGVQQPSPSVVTSPLKTLALDYNTVCKENLSFLLSCVPGLSTLTLSGLRQKKAEAASRGSSGIGAALSLVLGAGEECLLKHLDLTCCSLSDTDLEDISAYLYRCPHLSTVKLAHNPALTASSVTTFFSELTTNIALPLTALSLHGNEVVACTLKDQITAALRQKATTKHAVTKFSITAADPGVVGVENFWKSHHKKASRKKIGKEVFLSLSDI